MVSIQQYTMPIVNYLLILLFCLYTMSLTVPYEKKNQNLISCVNLILKHHFERKMITYIDMNYEGDEIIKIINNYPANVVSRDTSQRMSTFNVEYVITADTARDFIINFPRITKDPHYNPYAIFLIVVKTLENNDLKYIFDGLLTFHVKNVLLVNGTNEAELFTYNSFDNYNCGKKYDDIIEFGKCQRSSMKLLYRDKLVTRLRNCTFKATIAHWPPYAIDPTKSNETMIGVEQYVFKIISEQEGFKVQYTESIDGEDFSTISDNTHSGNFLKLQAKQTDFLFGGMLLVDFRADAFNYICGHLPYTDDLRFFVKKAGPVTGWKILILGFENTVWLILIVTFFCYFILLLVTLRPKDKTSLFLVMLDLLFLHGNRMISTSRGRFILWVFYAYLINSFYQSNLMSITANPIQNYQISTEEDLVEYNMENCVSLVFQKYIIVMRPEYSTQLRHHEGCDLLMESMQSVSRMNNKYTISLYSIYLYHKNSFFDGQGEEQVYAFKDPLNKVLYAIYFQKGFPFQKRLDLLALRLRENGLITRYLKLLYDKREKLFVKTVHHSTHRCWGDNFPWFILFIGNIISIGLFIVEVIYGKFSRHRRVNRFLRSN